MRFILFFFLYCSVAFAAPNPLLECLGKEEESFHKAKMFGPIYDLNQKLISSVLQFSDQTHLNKEIFDIACKAGVKSPSLYILEESLYDSTDLFYVEDSLKENPTSFNIQDNLIKEFVQNIPNLFMNFIAGVQAYINSPHCLEKKLPELNQLLLTIKHTENNKSLDKILKESKDINKIFAVLKDFEKLYQSCNKIKSQKKQ